MMDKQLDMNLFHALLWDESADDDLVIILKNMLLIEDPECIALAIRAKALGFWSGWAM